MATALCELSEKISTLAALAFPCNPTTAFVGRGVRYLPIFLQSLLLSKKPRHTGKLDKTLGAPIYLACLVAQSSYSCHSDSPFLAGQRHDSEYVAIQFPSSLAWALADPPYSSPHATAAIILILLLAPSGWLWRLFATKFFLQNSLSS